MNRKFKVTMLATATTKSGSEEYWSKVKEFQNLVFMTTLLTKQCGQERTKKMSLILLAAVEAPYWS